MRKAKVINENGQEYLIPTHIHKDDTDTEVHGAKSSVSTKSLLADEYPYTALISSIYSALKELPRKLEMEDNQNKADKIIGEE